LFPMTFVTFVDVFKTYEGVHLENEEFAGFPMDSIMTLQDIFQSHAAGSMCGGLKGKALFAVLDDLDIAFHSKEERQWYVDTVKRLDKNGDGSINFQELCQIIRTVVDMELVKKRMREFDIIKRSKLPFDEVEDWNVLYQQKDEEGQGELELLQIKELFTSIGVRWDAEFSTHIKDWILEADENNNGTLDFGEFCHLISKLWASNLHDVRGASLKFLKKDTLMSLRSVHGHYIGALSSGEVIGTGQVGANEIFTMSRQISGNVIFKGPHGFYVNTIDDKIECTREVEKECTQFKMTTLEDERVILVASTPFGGALYVLESGQVAISDGNPSHEPHSPFTMIKQDDLTKKCWSRSLPKRKPSKLVVEGRSNSKMKAKPVEEEPLSPGISSGIADIDAALATNMRSMGK